MSRDHLSPEALRAEAERLKKEALVLLAQAELLMRAAALKEGKRSVNVHGDMHQAHRLAISEAATEPGGFAEACRKAGYTQNQVAEHIGVKASLLSMHLNGKRPIPRERLQAVRDLIGWPRRDADWPGPIKD